MAKGPPSRSASCALVSCRQTTSAFCAASQGNRPFLAAERMPLTLTVTTRKNAFSTAGKTRCAAMRSRPLGRRVEEFLDFPDLRRGEIVALLHHAQHVPPGGEVMQAHIQLAHHLLRLGEDVVVEVDEHVLDHGARLAQRLAEIYFRAPVGGEVLDQQRPRSFANIAFDLRVAAEALRLQ